MLGTVLLMLYSVCARGHRGQHSKGVLELNWSCIQLTKQAHAFYRKAGLS